MKLDADRFAIAIANVFGVAALLCALLYKAAPAAYARGANFLLHTDMFTSTRPFGWGELVVATAAWWILVVLLAWASASLYNRTVRA